MKPEFITFTGVDDDTDPAGLVQLADDYPVEFGLLFSPKRQGEGRYPKLATITWMTEELPLRWSAHLCGGDARSWLYEDRCEHDLRWFQRVQINTADPNVQPSMVGNSAAKRNLRAILQCRGDFPRVASVDVLFDASGGRGIEAKAWPAAARTTFCGYAGGLKPENVAEAVRVIGQQGMRYWIDMESGVRDERDRFSLEKCRAVCEAVYGPHGVSGPVPARPRGVHALADVVSNLLQTGRYSDEEGEATAELLDLLKSLTDGALVPATPTQAMLDAADKVLDSDPRHIAEAWRAMVAAAGVTRPVGWQLVPVKPTEAMARAGVDAYNAHTSAMFDRVWEAMLAAAPAPAGVAPCDRGKQG